jgi:hypothetical protein
MFLVIYVNFITFQHSNNLYQNGNVQNIKTKYDLKIN